MADKKHDDRVTEIAGGRHTDEAPQVFKVGQIGSAHSGRREFLKNAMVAAAAGVSTATLEGCDDDPHSSQRQSNSSSSFGCVCSHHGGVTSLAIRSDGKLLVSASPDRTIKLWSLPDGALLNTFSGYANSMWPQIAVSPDGTMLASGTDDNTVKLWSLPDGALLKTLTGHSNIVLDVAFSPDGTLLASASDDKTIKLWSLPAGGLLKTILEASMSVAISPDGTLLASASDDFTIKLWSLPDGEL